MEMEITRYLLKAFEDGLDGTGIGYHGTSIEAIVHLLEHEVLPGVQLNGRAGMVLDFFSIRSQQADHLEALDVALETEALQQAEVAAGYCAAVYYIAKQLDLSLSDRELHAYGRLLCEKAQTVPRELHAAAQRIVCQARAVHLRRPAFGKILTEASEQRGVVILLNETARKYVPRSADSLTGLFQLVTADGLPYGMIIGVKPLGNRECDFLSALQERYAVGVG